MDVWEAVRVYVYKAVEEVQVGSWEFQRRTDLFARVLDCAPLWK